MLMLTGAILGSSLYVILSKGYADDMEKWAVGAVFGFWTNHS